jgi:hypothetical protein
MALNLASFYGDQFGVGPSDNWNIGPFHLGSCAKLLRVAAGVTISLPGDTTSMPEAAANGFVWGVQWVPHGNSPFNLPGDAFQPNFLFVRTTPADGQVDRIWAPSSDTAAVMQNVNSVYDWRAQRPINQDIDLYVSSGWTLTPFAYLGSMFIRVFNTT